MRTPGPWVRLAHDIYRNPKIATLNHKRCYHAIALYMLGLAWAGDNRQDGWIPNYALDVLGGTPKEATQLVEVGLWRADSGAGWWVHDWPMWQDSNEVRQQRTERMRGLANLLHHGHPDGPAPDA